MKRGPLLPFSAGFLAVVVIAYVGFEKGGSESISPNRTGSIAAVPGKLTPTPDPFQPVAVLPFAALSNGPDDDYFADGLTGEIIRTLDLLPGLRVTPRTSAFRFRGSDIPVGEIARQLGVTHVLTGSVQRAGDRLHVTARLLRAGDGFSLWEQVYDGRTRDAFAVRAEIAQKVASVLNSAPDADVRERLERAGTPNVDALIALQKGLEYHERAAREPNRISLLRQANVHFEDAFGQAPELLEAYRYHSELYTAILITQAAGELDGEIVQGDVEPAPERLLRDYQRAIRFAPTSHQRRIAVFDRALVTGDWRDLALRGEETAASPGCETSGWLHLLDPVTELTESIRGSFERMAACDPLRPDPWVQFAGVNLWLGDAERARDGARAGLQRVEHSVLAEYLALALALLGRHEEAASIARKHIRAEDELLLVQAMLAAIRGNAAASREFESEYLGHHGPNDRGTLVLAALRGNRAEANRLASLIDARPFGHLVLLQAVHACLCGAPFDLQATPTFAGRWSQSGLRWPPRRPFELQLKPW